MARRFLFYAVDGLGLGHVTRLIGVARALRRRRSDSEILFLTSSEADNVITREGFAAVKVPSKTLRERVGLGKGAYLRTVQTVSWSTISAFDPDVLIVDTYPAGSFEELLPVLRWRQRSAFVFREQRPEAAKSELSRATLRLYDRVIVPHDDLTQVGPLPEPEKALAVGPILIRDRNELLDRRRARQLLRLAEDRQIVFVSFGGGGDAEASANVPRVAEVVRRIPGVDLVVGLGPLAHAPGHIEGAAVLSGCYPALEFLSAFDAAIASAGYNLAHELLFAQVPTVLVPFDRQIDDQHRRAERLAAQGAALACFPFTSEKLEGCLREALDPGRAKELQRAARKVVSRNGADQAAIAILELL
jgi:UDP-N-acetylglucosamine--N-acetylmuramyl-(pentapeptide) pyrophosphoryl-undecaprenol N-acetylglucosamine transferase